MKIHKRSVPLDMLSFEHKGYRVYIGTEGPRVTIRVDKDMSEVHSQSMTPEQFISLLMRDAGGPG